MSGRTPVLVFARAPVPGATKRRLAQTIGAEAAAGLHRRMIHRAVAVAGEAGVGPVHLWCTPADDHPFFDELRSDFHVTSYCQQGENLGERMAEAFRQTLGRYPRAILIGTDCPFLEATDLVVADTHLRTGSDAVFVPAVDGGYVLVALSVALPAVFSGIPWGTDRVMDSTRTRLSDLGLRWHELPERRDIDRAADLESLGPEWLV